MISNTSKNHKNNFNLNSSNKANKNTSESETSKTRISQKPMNKTNNFNNLNKNENKRKSNIHDEIPSKINISNNNQSNKNLKTTSQNESNKKSITIKKEIKIKQNDNQPDKKILIQKTTKTQASNSRRNSQTLSNKTELNKKNNNNNEIKTKSNNIELEIKKLNENLMEKEKQNKLLNDENKLLKNDKIKYEEKILNINKENKSLNDKIRSGEEKYNQILSANNTMKNEINILNKKVELYENEINKLNNKIVLNENNYKEQLINNNKIKDEINKLNKKVELYENNYKQELLNNNKIKDEINKLDKKVELYENNYKEQILINNKLEDENKSLKIKIKEAEQKYHEIISKNSLISNINIKKDKPINNRELSFGINYDISIQIKTFNELLNGWEINYGKDGKKTYLSMKDKNILLVGLLGLKNVGKSYIISKLINESMGKKEESDNLFLKYIINHEKNFELAIIDTPGLDRPLKEYDNYTKSYNEKYIKELEKYNIDIDNFLINFILKKSNFVICVVGLLNFNEQNLLNKLKNKDKEYKKEYKQLKKLFVIHNLKELSTKEEVLEYINNVLLKSITFKLVEKETQLAQITLNQNNNTKFFIEKNSDKELEIYHFIIAKENSEAGNYYNESTFRIIIQQYNSFHFLNSFDIIKEIKKEIQSISKDIFTKPIKSLDDFENLENKIKVKSTFEFINNTEQNIDFSYLSLKPKYSYYKINNNSQLLIVIEMPGQIKEPNFVCEKKPKNGYYLMKFSGIKIINLPENLEEQKKNGSYYTNIEDGTFNETIKINVENFQLKSNKYSKFENENNGVYKYYFDLINNISYSDDDD